MPAVVVNRNSIGVLENDLQKSGPIGKECAQFMALDSYCKFSFVYYSSRRDLLPFLYLVLAFKCLVRKP
ncbi:hypothetical protein ACS0TY_022935 [Phlomoides rotata]